MRRRTWLIPPKVQREYDWAFAHWHELARRYPDQWIAFADHRVVAAGPNLRRVLTKAHRQVGWPHVPHLFLESGIRIYAH